MNTPGRYWPVIGAPVVTLTLSLGWTLDSINTVKLFALALVAGFALSEIISNTHRLKVNFISLRFALPVIFLISLFTPLLFSNSPVAQQIYGTTGRNLGFLHYFFLTLILIGISTMDANSVLPRIIKSLVITGALEAIYGSMQFLGIDPAPWSNPENWIFGTLGNPDYFSSFLALAAIATIYSAARKTKVWLRILYVLIATLEAGLIIASSATQGLVLFTFGVYSLFVLSLFRTSKILGWSSISLGGMIAVISLLGIFQKGPLSGYLFQDSISYRGDYWRAGLRMFQANWWHGVGLDSFGDYYRIFRDSTAANRRGLDVVSNSAHNLFIDLAATGGLALLLSYIAILVLVTGSMIKTFRSNVLVSNDYKVLVILWLAFNLQALISVNVSGLAVWGWVFSGLMLSFGKSSNSRTQKHRSSSKVPNTSSKGTWVLVGALLSCALLVAPLVKRDRNLAIALSENQIPEITDAVTSFPRNSGQIAAVASAYIKVGSYKESLGLARVAVSENPNAISAWRMILENPLSSQSQKVQAAKAMKALEPFLK